MDLVSQKGVSEQLCRAKVEQNRVSLEALNHHSQVGVSCRRSYVDMCVEKLARTMDLRIFMRRKWSRTGPVERP